MSNRCVVTMTIRWGRLHTVTAKASYSPIESSELTQLVLLSFKLFTWRHHVRLASNGRTLQIAAGTEIRIMAKYIMQSVRRCANIQFPCNHEFLREHVVRERPGMLGCFEEGWSSLGKYRRQKWSRAGRSVVPLPGPEELGSPDVCEALW